MKKRVYLLSFCVPLLIFIINLFLVDLYPFNDNITVLSGDYLSQYLGIYAGYKRMVTTLDFSELFWSFNKSLGTPTAAMWGYYVGFSPLNLIYLLFPMDKLMVASIVIMGLRHGLLGLSFAHLLRNQNSRKNKYDNNSNWIVIFSTIYSYSGFIVANEVNPIFLDILIFLPLLVLYLEKLIDDTSSKIVVIKFIGILIFMILIQFYIGYMVCIFIVIYGFGYVIMQDLSLRDSCLKYLKLGKYSVIAGLISSVVLLPIIFALFESKGAVTAINTTTQIAISHPINILSKLFIGTSTGAEWSVYSKGLPHLFVGSLSLIGLFHYFINAKINIKNKVGLFLILMLFYLSFVFTKTDELWHMGQRPYGFYYRNSWAINFVMILYAYRGLRDSFNIQLNNLHKYLVFFLFIIVALYGVEIKTLDSHKYYITIGFWLLNLMVLLLNNFNNKKLIYVLMLFIIALEIIINSFYILKSYPINYTIDSFNEFLGNYNKLESLLPDSKNNFYRVEMNKRSTMANQAFIDNYKGVTHSSSSIEQFLINGLTKLGLPAEKAFIYYISRTPLTDALFDIKYYVDKKEVANNQKDILSLYDKFNDYGENHYIFENKYNLELGFLVSHNFNWYHLMDDNPIDTQQNIVNLLFNDKDQYFEKIPFSEITYENIIQDNDKYHSIDNNILRYVNFKFDTEKKYDYFLRIPYSSKYQYKQSSVFLNDEPYYYSVDFSGDQIWNVAYSNENETKEFKVQSDSITTFNFENFELYRFDIEKFKDNIIEKQKDNILIEEYNNGYIKAKVDVKDPKLASAFFSIPFNSGWHVYVNGERVHPYKVWNTFTGFDLEQGFNQIEMKFVPPGLKIGVVISFVGFVLLFLDLRNFNNREII